MTDPGSYTVKEHSNLEYIDYILYTHEHEDHKAGHTCEDCEGTCGNCKDCSCPHHRAVPAFITLIALAFLLNAWNILSDASVAIIWPVLLGAIGVTKLMKGRCGCC